MIEVNGCEAIEMVESYDFPFKKAFSHWTRDNGYEDNAIYFYPSNDILLKAVEESQARENKLYVLDSLSKHSVHFDWRARYLDSDEIDVVFRGIFNDIRGYYFRDINVALFTDVTHSDNAYSRNILRELSIVLNKLHEEWKEYERHK